MVVSGVVLSFISFFTKGDVTDGVLWYMAQGLTFAGAIFGVSVYFKTKLGESENRIREFIRSISDRLPEQEPQQYRRLLCRRLGQGWQDRHGHAHA